MEPMIYRCPPRELVEYIEDCLKAGLFPYIRSSPGMGKSSLMRKVCKSFGLYMLDHRLSTSTPEDMSGLPKFQTLPDGREIATFVPFDMFPVEGTPLPKMANGKDYEGWFVFLDEFNSGQKTVQAAAYKVILDKMVGLRPLHKRVLLGGAGNLDTDRAITNPLSTAMQSRVVHLELMLDFGQWLEDVALAEGYDNRIISYLSYDNNKLMDFRPDHNDKTFCCPRTWEFMNRLVTSPDHVISARKAPLYAGTITSGVAADFVTFCGIYESLPKFNEIISNPETLEVPYDRQICWATIGHITDKMDETTFEKAAIYISRMPTDFQILFYRGLMVRAKKLRTHPVFRKAMVNLSRYFNESPYFPKEAA